MSSDSLTSPYHSLDKPIEEVNTEKPIVVSLKKQFIWNIGLGIAIPLAAFLLILSLFLMIIFSENIPILRDNPVVVLFIYIVVVFIVGFIIKSKYSTSLNSQKL